MEVDSDCDYNDYSSDYEPENSPIVKPKGKAKATAKPAAVSRSKAQPLAPSTSHNVQGGKAIEEIYQKKTQLEHILLRPDTYIGSTEKQQQTMWVHDGEKLVHKAITYAPGLFKIFDEILVNAADNKVRDPSMDTIRVDISPENNTIRVWNNGDGIPVEMHKEEGVYVPELIFGHLLTSSNYNDQEKKITGGRNGYGAKLANIFSTKFSVETCDGKRQRRFLQTFTNNMSNKTVPKITACKPTDNWTCISFEPDLPKFDMEELEADVVSLMAKRVYDVAGVLGKGCKVYLNGNRLPVKSFSDYCDLYLGPKDNGVPRILERINDRWEIVISATDGQFQQVSFVNSICTSKGGTHVNYIVDQICKHLVEKLNKKNKNNNVKPFMVKNHLWVFVNTQIENPAFDSQTKDTLTLKASSFGSKAELSPQLMDKVAKCGVMDNILSFAAFKNQKELKKSDGSKRSRVTGIGKLTDANDAGTKSSHLCTLILTEGDSAKTLAMSGLSVVGHDHWGIFPLRGKLLNVRDATALQISENQEIQFIKQILGLQHGKQYEDVKALRYGHLMIMTDQDHDGSHIKGLIMNFLHTFYPSLLKIPGFLVEFITPIIKARKGGRTLSFYTMPEYEAWKESLQGGQSNNWEIKYYKGLGTSSPKEAKEYFAAMDYHKKNFVWEDDEDGSAIEMAFSKKKVEDRKKWLSAYTQGTFLDQSVDEISYKDFVHKELILFSRADLERSIPSMVDGLKPGQRKILFCCFKRNLKKDIKVAQLSGYVAEHSAYHHGDASLQSTIVGLAQDFVGSNNLNLLYPSGQFGTRLQGGKDAASPRYIYTRLGNLTRHVFNKADDKVLNYLNEEGQSIEPEWYMPILPMVLVNGAEGIGTGWSTYIPNYSPKEVAANLRRLLDGQPMEPMQPWYRGFHGSITEVASKKEAGKSYTISGVIQPVGDNSVSITELPVRTWTQPYKEFLEGLLKGTTATASTAASRAKKADKDKDDDKPSEGPLLADYKEHHTDVSVHFDIDLVPGKLASLTATAGGLETKFKLNSKISTGNMMLFDAEGRIKRYDSPEEILKEFFDLRLVCYERRRVSLLQDAQWELRRASNKIRFIRAVIAGDLELKGRKRADIEADLEAQGFDKMAKSKDAAAATAAAAAAAAQGEDSENESSEAAAAAAVKESYDYLLSMAIYSLTWEKVQVLQGDEDTAAAEVARLEVADIRSMWAEDLDAFLEAYDAWEAEEAAQAVRLAKQQKAAKAKAGKAGKGRGKGKKATPWSDEEGDDGDDFDMDEEEEYVAPKPKKPAAPRAPRAPKAPAAAAAAAAVPASSSGTAATSSAAAGISQPQYKVKTAAPPKAGSKAAKAAAAAAVPAPVAAVAAAAAPAAPAESEPMSLADRLKKMAIKPANSGSTGSGAAAAAAAPTARPGRQAAKAAAKKYSLDDSDDDAASESDQEDNYSDDSDEVMSPAPAAAKPKARAAAAAASRPSSRLGPAAAAAAVGSSPSPKVAFGRTVSSSPAVEKKAAGKRKPRKKVVDSDDDDDAAEPSAGMSMDAYEAPTPSPAVARQKHRKVAGSPLPPLAFKTASRAPAAAAAKPKPPAAAAKPKAAAAAGKKKAAAVIIDSDEDEEMAAAAAAEPAAAAAGGRAQRARRAPAKTYVEVSDGEGGDDGDSDVVIDDESDYADDD